MKMGAHRNPKLDELMRLTGMSRREAVGTLELLWLFVMEQTPRGDVGKWQDGHIEAACDWTGEEGKLIQALLVCRWLDPCLDHRIVVHDWPDHATEFIQARARRALKAGTEYFVRHRPPTSDDVGQRAYSLVKSSHAKPREAKGSQGKDIPQKQTLEELFSEVQTARDLYLPDAASTPLSLTDKRQTQLATVRRDLGPTAHVDLVHGYVAFHLSSLADLAAGRGNGYDPMKYMTPETWWKGERGKYADADAAARAAGLKRPYTIDQIEPPPGSDPVATIMNRRRARAGN